MKVMRIKNMEQLTNHGNVKARKLMADILEAGMQAADPYYNSLEMIDIIDGELHIGKEEFEMIGTPFNKHDVYKREDIDRVFIFGAGKGILSVVKALEEKLGDWLTDGYVIGKHGDEIITQKVQVKLAAHPVPDQHCMDGCEAMVEMIQNAKLTERDLVITAIGNGVSSLLTYPMEGLTIDDVKEVTRYLQIECGANTGDLNEIRNNIDRLKAGRITKMLAPAKMVHIIAVDPNRTHPTLRGYDALLAGNKWLHTLPDTSSPKRGLEVLARYEALEHLSKVVEVLKQQPEEPVLPPSEFESMDVRIYGVMPEHRSMPQRVEEKCKELGLTPHVFLRTTAVEASAMGKVMAGLARMIENGESLYKAPCVLINYGEMVVTVDKATGVGGRNQEFALSGATVIAGSERIAMGAVDTDGTDGPGGNFDEQAYAAGIRNLAGGIVDGMTMQEAADKGVDVLTALRNHGTSSALWHLDSGVYATQCISINDIALTLVMGE